MNGDDLIGARVREARGSMSQTELADTMQARQVPWIQNTVTTIETGRRPLRFTEAVVLSDELGVSLDWLAGRGPEMDDTEPRRRLVLIEQQVEAALQILTNAQESKS